MSAHQEVEEQAHHAQNPFDKRVAGTMAIIASLLAIVSVLGQHFNTETLLSQQIASDQWAYYQAKEIRKYAAQVAADNLAAANANPSLVDRYSKDVAKYSAQSAEIQRTALEHESERDKAARESYRFDFGEVFFEVAIVVSSLAILTKRKLFFTLGVLSAAVGIVTSVTGFWA